MAWDGVPWFVENTVTSEETLRLIAEVAAGGGEGIVGPADLLVTALDAPAAAVQVGPGAMVARRQGIGLAQSYAARMPTAEQVSIEPTGADGPRSDLIIARVEDPFGGELWPEPEDPAIGPYVYTRVLSDVPPGTTSIHDVDPTSTAVTLARVDLEASTGSVTAAMVTDLRQMARPRSQTSRHYLYRAWETPDELGPITDVWEEFPLGASWATVVPAWATHVSVHISVTGLLHPDATAAEGMLRVTCGDQAGAQLPFEAAQAGRIAAQTGHTFVLPPEERGQVVRIGVEGIGTAGVTGLVRADAGTVLCAEITYAQAPAVV
ncbi:hypothetical protein ACFUJY_29215 [Streptomyces sp. NPDC057249]|uniref:hypothetical protein n=1 Tax=Streptomyces sp. NPDC057249 TaxID=3346067 RepID=UPI00363BF91A